MIGLEYIKSFSGQYDWLSNFYPSPIVSDGLLYPTVEHYYQSMKMANKSDADLIRWSASSGLAKRSARKLPMKAEWNSHLRYTVMSDGLLLKFTQHKLLHDKLILTGDAILIEGNNWHDNIWGSCFCDKCRLINGHNILGRKLMELRDIFNEIIHKS